MSQLAQNPKDVLNEGATRAKNMAVAVVMICALLTKYFFVKIAWSRVERLIAIMVVKSANVLSLVLAKLHPHLEKAKLVVQNTKNQVIRVVLGALIMALTPIEGLMIKYMGVAKVQSEKLAVKSSNTAMSVLASAVRAVSTAIQSGLTRPAMQKALNKLFALVEEAQRG